MIEQTIGEVVPREVADSRGRLEVVNLSKSFSVGSGLARRHDRVLAVDSVSFVAQPGTTVGIIGESGSGKSTVARMICRLIKPDSGSVLVDGVDVHTGSQGRKAFSRSVQIVFQDPTSALNPRWTMGALVAEGLRLHHGRSGHAIRPGVIEIVERCGLDREALNLYPHEFSGGQRQRIAIARALAVRPKVLVLDEPVSALDVSVQAQILVLLQELQRDLGITYVLISHDLAVVEQFCDGVVVMKSGAIVEAGAPEDLQQNPQHPYTRDLIDAHPVPDPRTRRVVKQQPAEQ